jgi:SAM-dependent methyltransferase
VHAADAATSAPRLVRTSCPICGEAGTDREVYPANFDPAALDPAVFSARRTPDRLHYRMVRCVRCGLLRSNPILPLEDLSRLYGASHFTYQREAAFTGKTYATYLRRALAGRPWPRSLMEVGCGSGFFLSEAARMGIAEVSGVEPSQEAIEHADPELRGRIRCALYDTETFEPERFDVICAFQVFDHVPDPAGMLRACFCHLRPGGMVLFINHDSGALTNRLLGERSPIVDVEHTALYDRSTMRRILEATGFTVREVFGVKNTYPLGYWTRLAPLPSLVKDPLVKILERSRVGELPVSLYAGNLGAIATKERPQ